MRRKRTFSVLFALGVVLLVPTVPSTSSVPPSLPDVPSPEEVAAWEEFLTWVQGGESTEYRLSGEERLSDAIRSRPRGFELFRGFLGTEERRQLLASLPYGEVIDEAAEAHQLDGLLVAAVVRVESGVRAGAISPRGALGLMQLMPETAELYGVTDVLEPALNVEAGASYLRSLLDRFHGDLELALAAYNAGPGAVERFGGVPPYRETISYVEKVLSSYVSYHRQLWEYSPLADLWLVDVSSPRSRPGSSPPLPL